MKKNFLFLFAAVFLLAFASCNLEKRLYRNGWYFEKNKPHTLTTNSVSNPVHGISAYENPEKPASTPDSVAADSFALINDTVNPVIKSQLPDSSLPQKDLTKMSRRELLKSMKEKGCAKPHSSADTVYWLAITSICVCWMIPLALILALVTILLCESAEKEVIAKGECPRENLELIRRGRRLAKGFLFVSLFVGIALVALLFTALILVLAGIF